VLRSVPNMSTGKPITPDEAEVREDVPGEVFDAFNELIREGHGTVKQVDVVTRILFKMPHVERHEIFNRGWLNVEGAYRKAGWTVQYDKPGYNESYEAYFTFTRRR
jgi:hypothetical protein